MIDAPAALQRLREGNQRFASGTSVLESDPTERAEHLSGQEPFAVILGCSDSRVPAEIVFDQGLGDLFVIRVAGNIVAPSLVGSVEYAAIHLGSRLAVVLGHSGCGAVRATIEQVRHPAAALSPNMAAIIDQIRPSVEPLMAVTTDDLIGQAVRANIGASAEQLRHGSVALSDLVRDDGLLVIGAHYSLETGIVDFSDGSSVEAPPK
jgi:carbonic anhydrase